MVVWVQVVEDLMGRDSESGASVLVVNLDVKDNHEEAALAAPQVRASVGHRE